ncbi:hypothetical protein F0P96_14805 [Hymenobacter busanensis]|uniref:Uncharacterized protein n=1 Tax=Hymenobacter busanensis TaxID=2607656 RepID=A0A7L4ZZG2_9BACT|nr:hypothetical protein [Hymenobacter busanensis]KAA9331507.1 hypothetical protein F0P96_14805 [Hymenobacter busanensis]QHJ08661.1 hypothetical protein GUY19_15740 [Hymenobacter busanensis]
MIIKTLLIFFLVATLLRMVLPLLMRWLLTTFVRKQMERGGVRFDPRAAPFGAPPPPNPGPEGKVRVDYVPPAAKPRRAEEFRGGDYVDFEEVK